MVFERMDKLPIFQAVDPKISRSDRIFKQNNRGMFCPKTIRIKGEKQALSPK
jgi:hypothetical protein